jgi:hypothetical protein
MIYQKPKIRSIEDNSDMMCGNGSGANSSGCTDGISVYYRCATGNGDDSCID